MREDDFDRLGRAVAAVLRGAFETAEEIRSGGGDDAESVVRRAEAEAVAYVRQAAEVPSAARLQAEHLLLQLKQAAESLPPAPTVDDPAIDRARQEAAAIVERARERHREVVAAVNELLAEARVEADEARRQAAADADEVVAHVRQLLDRARRESASLVRRARAYHAASVREAERMLEAAAKDSAALRRAAIADGFDVDENPVAPAGKPEEPRRPEAAIAPHRHRGPAVRRLTA